jgi:hypothetical protein
MRNVMIVVDVLITNCQVSEKPKKGPEIAHAATNPTAETNVIGFPEALAIALANLAKILGLFDMAFAFQERAHSELIVERVAEL